MIRRLEGNSCDSGFSSRAFMLRSFAKSSRILQRRPELSVGTGHDHSRQGGFPHRLRRRTCRPRCNPGAVQGQCSPVAWRTGLVAVSGPGRRQAPPRPPSCLSTRASAISRTRPPIRRFAGAVSTQRFWSVVSETQEPKASISSAATRNFYQPATATWSGPGCGFLFLRAIWTAVA